jgi:hypothetical protein
MTQMIRTREEVAKIFDDFLSSRGWGMGLR